MNQQRNDLCIGALRSNVHVKYCNADDKNQLWTYDTKFQLIHDATGMCLTMFESSTILLFECRGLEQQKWDFEKIGGAGNVLLKNLGSSNLCLDAPWSYKPVDYFDDSKTLDVVPYRCERDNIHQVFYKLDYYHTARQIQGLKISTLEKEKSNATLRLNSALASMEKDLNQKDQIISNISKELEILKKEKASEVSRLHAQLGDMEKEKKDLERDMKNTNEMLGHKLSKCVKTLKQKYQ